MGTLTHYPFGDPTPMPDDIAITRVIMEAGKLLDVVEALDHIAIGHGRYCS